MRLLVLGLGFFGQTWLREIQAHPDCEVAGVLTKHPDVLAAVGDKFNIPPSRRYTTLEESLKCPDAQAVVVALPEMLHRAAIVAAIKQHGGNVSAAARQLGLHRQSLQQKMTQLGITR